MLALLLINSKAFSIQVWNNTFSNAPLVEWKQTSSELAVTKYKDPKETYDPKLARASYKVLEETIMGNSEILSELLSPIEYNKLFNLVYALSNFKNVSNNIFEKAFISIYSAVRTLELNNNAIPEPAEYEFKITTSFGASLHEVRKFLEQTAN